MIVIVSALTIAAGQASTRRHLYTPAQAVAGERSYGKYCASCHGSDLRGPQAPLVGPAFLSLGTDMGITIGTFFDFIVRDTPAGRVGRLSHREYVEILAFILEQNGYAAGTQPLVFDRAMRERTKIGDARR